MITMPAAASRCALPARVWENRSVGRDHFHLELAVDGLPTSRAGQFVQIRCADFADAGPRSTPWLSGDWPCVTDCDFGAPTAYLRRPFSVADRWRDAEGVDHILIIHHAIGPGTRWLSALAPGATVDLTGPLGRPFDLPAPDRPALLVGGGVGIPPLLYLARELAAEGRREVLLVIGARSRDLLPIELCAPPSNDATPTPCAVLPSCPAHRAVVTTDDGSAGLHGRVTDGLRACLDRQPSAEVLACGPEPMLRGVAAMARERSVPCQLCIERMMGCGLGTCLSCAVKVRDERCAAGWRFALSCQEGPVFRAENLLINSAAPPRCQPNGG
ncbi:MAG: Dihydroorotate dehydrogenase B (NAD(+)), electron transfer subunit [Phycisphaerae bacterium]|nr:Dihydroorotate dehydrogenase B (NAD(+)), electron transfer subunit [Phycisphaerae bacterium]